MPLAFARRVDGQGAFDDFREGAGRRTVILDMRTASELNAPSAALPDCHAGKQHDVLGLNVAPPVHVGQRLAILCEFCHPRRGRSVILSFAALHTLGVSAKAGRHGRGVLCAEEKPRAETDYSELAEKQNRTDWDGTNELTLCLNANVEPLGVYSGHNGSQFDRAPAFNAGY